MNGGGKLWLLSLLAASTTVLLLLLWWSSPTVGRRDRALTLAGRPRELVPMAGYLDDKLTQSSWKKQRRKVFQERNARVRTVCQNMRKRKRWSKEVSKRNFLIDPDHGLVYCRHGKVLWNNAKQPMIVFP